MDWTVRLSQAAQADFAAIIDWTFEPFGERQAIAHAATLTAAIQELHATGPDTPGIRAGKDIRVGLLTLHLSRSGRKGRHFLMLRTRRGAARLIEVVRILHDAMDLPRHLP